MQIAYRVEKSLMRQMQLSFKFMDKWGGRKVTLISAIAVTILLSRVIYKVPYEYCIAEHSYKWKIEIPLEKLYAIMRHMLRIGPDSGQPLPPRIYPDLSNWGSEFA